MQITVTGQHMDITPPLREYVEEKLERIARHLDNVATASIVLHVEKERHQAEATINASDAPKNTVNLLTCLSAANSMLGAGCPSLATI